jgi:hypothetical protein
MSFRPLTWSVGLALSVLSVLALLATAGLAIVRRRRGDAQRS